MCLPVYSALRISYRRSCKVIPKQYPRVGLPTHSLLFGVADATCSIGYSRRTFPFAIFYCRQYSQTNFQSIALSREDPTSFPTTHSRSRPLHTVKRRQARSVFPVIISPNPSSPNTNIIVRAPFVVLVLWLVHGLHFRLTAVNSCHKMSQSYPHIGVAFSLASSHLILSTLID